MSLCPEAEFRDGLTEAEFWDYVFNGRGPDDGDDDYGPDLDDTAPSTPLYPSPCPECGARSACAFDIEGRPLIHATEKAS